MKVNMHEAKTQLSKLAELAWKGERVIIAKAGKPYLDLVPHRGRSTPRRPGLLKGQIKLAPDFDEIDSELMSQFEGD